MLPVTRRSRRRAQVARHAQLREFATQLGWKTVPLTVSVAEAFPAPPLYGAVSAQAELAVTGEWGGSTMTSAIVSVRTDLTKRSSRDLQTVLLTVLDFGPDGREFIATVVNGNVVVAPITMEQPAPSPHVRDLLVGVAAFRPGDTVAFSEVQLFHARPVRARDKELDINGPVKLLASLASVLAERMA